MTKKILALLLAMVMLAAAFSGCAPAPAKPGPTQPKPGTTSEEPMEITWLPYNQIGVTAENGTEVQKLVEERFNVKIKMEQVDIHSLDQWNLYWATGKKPDIAFMNSPASVAFKLAKQGLVREIPADYYDRYLPDFMKAFDGVMDREMLMGQLSDGGKAYLMPYHAGFESNYLMAVRKDWMDKLGITKMPTNPDEMLDMLKRFTLEDPDGNGKNDTFGIHGGSQRSFMRFGYVHTYFNLWPDTYVEKDGKITYSSQSQAYKDELKLLNSWFKAGVIDPEFATEDRNVQRKKWAEGKFGVITDNPWWFSDTTPANLTKMLKDANPEAEIVFMEPFVDPEGKQKAWHFFPEANGDGSAFFGANCSDEKMQKIMEIRNSFAADWDFYIRCRYGVEGTDYTVKEGIVTPTVDATKPEYVTEKGLGHTFAITPLSYETQAKYILSKADVDAYNFSGKFEGLSISRNFNYTGPTEQYSLYKADVKTVADEFYYNAIMGKVDIDKDWDQFQKTLLSTGLDKILQEYQTGYDAAKK